MWGCQTRTREPVDPTKNVNPTCHCAHHTTSHTTPHHPSTHAHTKQHTPPAYSHHARTHAAGTTTQAHTRHHARTSYPLVAACFSGLRLCPISLSHASVPFSGTTPPPYLARSRLLPSPSGGPAMRVMCGRLSLSFSSSFPPNASDRKSVV